MQAYKWFINSDTKKTRFSMLNKTELNFTPEYFDLIKVSRLNHFNQVIFTPTIVKRIFRALLKYDTQTNIIDINNSFTHNPSIATNFENFDKLTELEDNGQFDYATLSVTDHVIKISASGIIKFSGDTDVREIFVIISNCLDDYFNN